MAKLKPLKEKKVGIIQRRKNIRALIKTIKDPEFLEEIELLLSQGRKLTELERLENNMKYDVMKTVEWVDTRFDRQKGMQMFLEDVWY